MGKLTSIYLTDEEFAELKKFCEENQCSQYSAIKTAVRELVSKHSLKKGEKAINLEGNAASQNFEDDESSAEKRQNEESNIVERLARCLRSQT
jgi:hypothetical protein